jgi:hypothetical protein
LAISFYEKLEIQPQRRLLRFLILHLDLVESFISSARYLDAINLIGYGLKVRFASQGLKEMIPVHDLLEA